MHPTRLLLPALLASLLSLLLLLHRARAACEPATCGDLNISYPFWLGAPGQPPPSSGSASCGPPPFEVWCSTDGVASLRSSSIHVLHVDYSTSSFVASHSRVADGANGVCSTDFNMSSIITLSPFSISATGNRALCFLYNCNGTGYQNEEYYGEEEYVNATSTCGKPILAHLDGNYDRDNPPAIPAGNCTYAFLPVLASAAATSPTNTSGYNQLLKAGFLLEWPPTVNADCAGCEVSGGQCRYNNDSAERAFACLCTGGVLRGPRCAGEFPRPY